MSSHNDIVLLCNIEIVLSRKFAFQVPYSRNLNLIPREGILAKLDSKLKEASGWAVLCGLGGTGYVLAFNVAKLKAP